jgi:hypothetical protein
MRQTRIFGVYQLLHLHVEEEVPLDPQQLLQPQQQLPLLVKAYNLGLEITIVMMKTTMLHVSLMVEIAVIMINLIGIFIAQTANVLNLLVKVLEA